MRYSSNDVPYPAEPYPTHETLLAHSRAKIQVAFLVTGAVKNSCICRLMSGYSANHRMHE